MKERRQAEKAEEERVVEIEKWLEIKKKEKAEAERKQQELEKNKKEEEEKKKKKKDEREKEKKEEVEVARRKAKLIKLAVRVAVMLVQKVAQPTIEVRTSIEAVTSPIETATPLVSMNFTLVFVSLMSLFVY